MKKDLLQELIVTQSRNPLLFMDPTVHYNVCS
jgi:hypothetical protein